MVSGHRLHPGTCSGRENHHPLSWAKGVLPLQPQTCPYCTVEGPQALWGLLGKDCAWKILPNTFGAGFKENFQAEAFYLPLEFQPVFLLHQICLNLV